MNKKLRIVFGGTPELARDVLAHLLKCEYNIVGVLTQPDKPRGRGNKITPSPVKELALQHGIINILQPKSLKKEPEYVEQIKSLNPDVIVIAAYGLILPQSVLDIGTYGCINIHISLLPRHRGAAPIQRSILCGDTKTGVTIMQMDAGLDTGDIILQESLPILNDDNSDTLTTKLVALGSKLIVNYLENPTLPRIKQPLTGDTYAHKIEKEEALINWSLSAKILDRQIRGFNPSPISYFNLGDEVIKVHKARVFENTSNKLYNPGEIVTFNKNQLVVSCGENSFLEIILLQLPNKKPQSIIEIFNGGKLNNINSFDC